MSTVGCTYSDYKSSGRATATPCSFTFKAPMNEPKVKGINQVLTQPLIHVNDKDNVILIRHNEGEVLSHAKRRVSGFSL